MNTSTEERQKLIAAVNTLPEQALGELASFIDYLRYKSAQPATNQNGSAFLLSIAGIGASQEQDVSERDEEILRAEVDPIRGWHHDPNHSA
jgi:hypothetical protein